MTYANPRPCAEPECTKTAGKRSSRCPMHDARKSRSAAKPCSVGDCTRGAHSRGLCQGHYDRWRKYGDAEALPSYAPRTHSNGYTTVTFDTFDHVLALPGRRSIYAHRLAMFDVIGYGPHSCHWCGRHVNWRHPRPADLEVDHLDANRGNNDLANLVASCHRCNSRRAHGLLPLPINEEPAA